jgi:putative hemolysin
MIVLLIPLILIIIEGIFTASETGLVSIENITVLKARREKKRWAQRVHTFLKKPERFFSTILVCENFIIVIASTLFATYFIRHFGDNGIFVSTIVLSLVSLAIGQYIPKSIALSNPYRTMSLFSETIYVIERAAYPVVSFYAMVARAIAHLFTRDTRQEAIQRLDIVHAMGEYEKKASMLAARLFNFSRRPVAEVMIPLPAVFTCEKGSELDVFKKEHKRVYTRIPVYEKEPNNIIGVFNIKDYFYTKKIVLRKPFFVTRNDRCMTIFTIMKQKGEHLAIVRDADGCIMGIVTLEDLIEELVGEIRDEK